MEEGGEHKGHAGPRMAAQGAEDGGRRGAEQRGHAGPRVAAEGTKNGGRQGIAGTVPGEARECPQARGVPSGSGIALRLGDCPQASPSEHGPGRRSARAASELKKLLQKSQIVYLKGTERQSIKLPPVCVNAGDVR